MTKSKSIRKLTSVAFITAALTAMASPGLAQQTITITGPSGTFGNPTVVCAGIATTCAFTNTFNFITPTGFNLVNATISTSAQALSNIDFTSVLLNGSSFTLTPTGTFEFGTLPNTGLTPLANNVLTVNGQNTGDGAFSGVLTFAAVSAVPEPGTWAMMLLGFGAMGVSMRRRRRGTALLQVA